MNKRIRLLVGLISLIIIVSAAVFFGTTNKNERREEVLIPLKEHKISYIRTSVNGTGLHVANGDGSNEKLVGENARYHSWDWSPDNQFIVSSYGTIIDVNSGEKIKIPSGRCHSWSSTNNIIYEKGREIWVMNNVGQNARKLIDDGFMCRGSNSVNQWMPDGNSFVYLNNKGIYLYNIEKNTNSLIFDSQKDMEVYDVVVSKRGDKIAFLGDEGSTRNIFLMKPDGSDVTQLTNFKDGDPRFIFTPSGESLIITHGGLSILDIESKNIKTISSPINTYYPPSVSSDGQFASFYASYEKEKIVNILTGEIIKLPFVVEHILWSK